MTEYRITGVDVKLTTGWEKNLDLVGLASYIGDSCVDTAKRIVPVDTGALKGSLRYDVASGGSATEASVMYSANTYYALYVEKGTINTRPQPYLMPALRPGAHAALREWKPGKRKAMNSGKTITAKEAGMERAGRVNAVKNYRSQASKNLAKAMGQQNLREAQRELKKLMD